MQTLQRLRLSLEKASKALEEDHPAILRRELKEMEKWIAVEETRDRERRMGYVNDGMPHHLRVVEGYTLRLRTLRYSRNQALLRKTEEELPEWETRAIMEMMAANDDIYVQPVKGMLTAATRESLTPEQAVQHEASAAILKMAEGYPAQVVRALIRCLSARRGRLPLLLLREIVPPDQFPPAPDESVHKEIAAWEKWGRTQGVEGITASTRFYRIS